MQTVQYIPVIMDALILDVKEFNTFTEKYQDAKNLTPEEMSDLITDMACHTMIWESCTESDNHGQPFPPFEVKDLDEDVKNVSFMLLSQSGKQEGNADIDLTENWFYAIPASKDRFTAQALDNPPYANAEALYHDFYLRLHAYLPDDFRWEKHIGVLTYVDVV